MAEADMRWMVYFEPVAPKLLENAIIGREPAVGDDKMTGYKMHWFVLQVPIAHQERNFPLLEIGTDIVEVSLNLEPNRETGAVEDRDKETIVLRLVLDKSEENMVWRQYPYIASTLNERGYVMLPSGYFLQTFFRPEAIVRPVGSDEPVEVVLEIQVRHDFWTPEAGRPPKTLTIRIPQFGRHPEIPFDLAGAVRRLLPAKQEDGRRLVPVEPFNLVELR